MYKFFVNQKIDNYFVLDEDIQRHIKVIRLKNEPILINYQNEYYKCNFVFPNKAEIIEKLNINHEYKQNVIVAIPIIKLSNFEIALQKAVELGAKEIIPFTSEYTDKSNLNIVRKYDRFNKIILEAAQQSFRNAIPKLNQPKTYEEIINNYQNIIIAYENEKQVHLQEINQDCLLMVGPEGGFSEAEISKAKQKNIEIVMLSPAILRAETALIYMLSRLK
ncbi:16S rRNA (uracil(1498)-N(3))-methyltransferase [[Mycoplasma] falconis]|uniref:Ribosomal RNA small subunit methyltransferase E n=1 Tax=[Mycoplasma] falconis TaxID=92403 RepID=A0A501XA64_9BACT|nr:16S rRNA (uracil(1498)-N(3))-methyltransferase [[Mycoplasma] falconis]TPE57366.1 16S rRNA (uracil(1498)-N(3))-methyltransferase [[Mycoplasma] falconis]